MAKKKPKNGLTLKQPSIAVLPSPRLVSDLRRLIEESRQHVARTVDSGLVWLCWRIGKRIREDILKEERAEYGRQIVATLSRQLTPEFGRGYSEKSLWRRQKGSREGAKTQRSSGCPGM